MARPPNEPNPSDGPLELFATEHRRYRKRSGLTQAALADQLNYTPQFVGMIEVAERTPSRQYVDGADRILNADGGLINCWLLLTRLHIPKWFGPFMDVEAQATAMHEWEWAFIPGLLQTAAYATALIKAGRPHISDEKVEHEVDVRMHRQELLHRPAPPMLWTVIDEYAFRRVVGGPGVMRAQLDHLLKMAELPNVVVQILPFDAGPHPGQIGAFKILELDDQPGVVWVEGPDEGHFIDREDQVAECIRRYDHLRAMALSPAASRKMITAPLE